METESRNQWKKLVESMGKPEVLYSYAPIIQSGFFRIPLVEYHLEFQ